MLVVLAVPRLVNSALPFCCALMKCSHCCSSVLQCCRSDLYVSAAGSCCLIQSHASWYLIACCSNIILMVSVVCWSWKLQLFTKLMILVLRVCTCSSGCCLRSLRTSSLVMPIMFSFFKGCLYSFQCMCRCALVCFCDRVIVY